MYTAHDASREGVVYEQAGTYLWVEAQLMKPLVPQRPLSALAQRWVGVGIT